MNIRVICEQIASGCCASGFLPVLREAQPTPSSSLLLQGASSLVNQLTQRPLPQKHLKKQPLLLPPLRATLSHSRHLKIHVIKFVCFKSPYSG